MSKGFRELDQNPESSLRKYENMLAPKSISYCLLEFLEKKVANTQIMTLKDLYSLVADKT